MGVTGAPSQHLAIVKRQRQIWKCLVHDEANLLIRVLLVHGAVANLSVSKLFASSVFSFAGIGFVLAPSLPPSNLLTGSDWRSSQPGVTFLWKALTGAPASQGLPDFLLVQNMFHVRKK